MSNMAAWGPKEFTVSPTKVAAITELTTSLTLKEDSENDTSGTQPTNTRGRELRPITFNVTYLAAAGVNPREEVASWESELGNAYPFIVGGRCFGAPTMKLTAVSTSDILLSNSGEFLRAVVSITLEEDSDGKKSKLLSNAIPDSKKSALNAGAKKLDKVGTVKLLKLIK